MSERKRNVLYIAQAWGIAAVMLFIQQGMAEVGPVAREIAAARGDLFILFMMDAMRILLPFTVALCLLLAVLSLALLFVKGGGDGV